MTAMSSSTKKRLSVLSKERTELLSLMLEERSRRRQIIKPRGRSGAASKTRLPTSWAQQRLWFIDQLEAGSAGYQVPVAWRLRGSIDRDSLQMALNALVQRHEVLRTVFVSADGDSLQEISSQGHLTLIFVDLSDYGEVERERQLRRLRTEEAHCRFDLQEGPLIRARLVRLNERDHVLLITMHHIVCDGWSIGVLSRDLVELYRSCRGAGTLRLSPLPVQYADYAIWQRQWLYGQGLSKQLDYWRSRLTGAAPQLELPTDRPRPFAQSYRGANVAVVLGEQLGMRLRDLARRSGMTLFMVLYAGWSILLSKLSNQSDIVVGTPFANRQRPELEGLIGFFVNTLVLRVEVQGGLSTREFLQYVKEVILGAYDHQDAPFEKVVEALQPERSLSRNPLFQVMFALQNTPKDELQLPGLTMTLEEGVDELSVFDLFLSLEERGDAIVGSVNYSVDLFDRSTIDRWMACFATLLEGLVDQERGRIDDLPILPSQERREVVELFNETQVAYERQRLVQELFEAQVRRTGQAVAVEYEGQSLTYEQLNQRSNQLARYLRERGVGTAEVVGICIERGIPMVIGLLGIMKAGAAYMPLDPNYPRERLQYMLEDAAPRLVLTQGSVQGSLPEGSWQAVALDEQWERIEGYGRQELEAAQLGLGSQQWVYVIYTSGSTGRPKGTAMAHRSMVNLIEWHRRSFAVTEGRRVLQFAALSFDVAFQEIFTTLCTGGTLVLLDEWVRRDAQALVQLLSSESIHRLFVPPLMLQSLAESCKASDIIPRGLQDVITAGEQLRISDEIVELFERLEGCRLHNHYGPTETHVVAALSLEGPARGWPELPAIGRPIANTQIYVLDAGRQPVPVGVRGEIYIGGANVAWGYLKQPELTAQRFIEDPFGGEPRGRLYRTGDLGRWRSDGTLEYLGRNDDQVKIRGYRIELGEVEGQLMRHAQVKEAAVVVREDAQGERRLVGYVTRRDPSGPTVEQLRSHLQAQLPEHMVPSALVVLESLPLTPSGKLDRRALPAPELEAYASRVYEAPQGEIEQAVAQIWQELLRVERVGRSDNFFELGGHSLLGMRLIAKVLERLGVRLSVVAVFQYPTVRQMAKVVESLQSVTAGECLSGLEFEEGII